LLGPDFIRVDTKSQPPIDRLPGDLVFENCADPSRTVTVFLHGSFTDPMEYDHKLTNFLMQLIGASRLTERVIGIAPYGRPYWSFFDKHDIPSDNIEIHEIDYEVPGFAPAVLARGLPPRPSA
jgi:hypothetical protein